MKTIYRFEGWVSKSDGNLYRFKISRGVKWCVEVTSPNAQHDLLSALADEVGAVVRELVGIGAQKRALVAGRIIAQIVSELFLADNLVKSQVRFGTERVGLR